MGRRASTRVAIFAGGVVAVTALVSAAAVTEDVVTLKPQAGEAPTRVRGEVVDYTGERLLLKTATGREQSIPGERVERIETSTSAEHRAADAHFTRREFR
jgi:hypothetical protein